MALFAIFSGIQNDVVSKSAPAHQQAVVVRLKKIIKQTVCGEAPIKIWTGQAGTTFIRSPGLTVGAPWHGRGGTIINDVCWYYIYISGRKEKSDPMACLCGFKSLSVPSCASVHAETTVQRVHVHEQSLVSQNILQEATAFPTWKVFVDDRRAW